MDSSQHQEMPNSSMESMLGCSKAAQDRKPRPNPEQAQKCPRCDSTNTKFCYYNNYSLSQPRYFCKSCRRYWTKGGTLRNVPVGGGCRKNRRSSSSIKRTNQDPQNPNPNTNPMSGIPSLSCYDSSDHLSLAFARLQKGQQLGFHEHELSLFGNSIINTSNAGVNHGFLGANHNFQNLYYGFGNGEVEDCGEGQNQMMHMFPYDHQNPEINTTTTTTTAATTATTVTTMKQEMISNIGRDHGVSDQNKVLWGFPWQMNGDGGESWNGFNSSWHGLINSPLM